MNSADKIIFIVPPLRWFSSRYSLGIMYVSSYLREHGYRNSIIDSGIIPKGFTTQEDVYKSIIEVIEDKKPEFVGIGCLITEIKEVVDLNKRIKAVSPKTKTLVGGTQAFDTPEIFLRNSFDYVVSGEGEITTLELIETLSQEKEVDKIEGIVWRKNGSIIYNKPRPLIEDINTITYPSYDLVNMKLHLGIHDWIVRGLSLKTAMVATSRGCPYDCSFCECNAIFGRKLRYRSYENIYGEIKLLRDKYEAEAIWFVDDTLTVNKKHIDKICGVMKKLKIWWCCQGRTNTVDSEMVKKMKKSGCIQIDFGVESGSDRILNEIINKGATLEDSRRVFQACHKYRMRTFANLMIGLPTETKVEMLQTLRLGKEINADAYTISIATPFRSSKLWDMTKPDIADDELYKLDFFNSEIVDNYNRSEVKGLVALRQEFLLELDSRYKIKKFFSKIKWLLKIFYRTRYKKEYLRTFSGRIKRRVLFSARKLFTWTLR